MSNRRAFSFLSVLAFAGYLLTSCSAYQSDGRKFLEEQGITFAANSRAALAWSFEAKSLSGPCAELVTYPDISEQDWQSFELSLAPQYKKESLLQTTVTGAHDVFYCVEDGGRHFLCALYFDSEHERNENLNQDLEFSRQNIEKLKRL